jgi:hypothetical protein
LGIIFLWFVDVYRLLLLSIAGHNSMCMPRWKDISKVTTFVVSRKQPTLLYFDSLSFDPKRSGFFLRGIFQSLGKFIVHFSRSEKQNIGSEKSS